MIGILQSICRFNFGIFEREEFKKFLKMGAIFSLIIGVYWTLRPLKDAIFIDLVGKEYLPFAKTVSVFALLPLVMGYTKLLEVTSREKMLHIMPTFYGILVLGFALLMYFVQGQTYGPLMTGVGYIWYLLVESFGSLVVALFWAFAADTTHPDHAKRGFPLVVAIGQFGGILFPVAIGGLPHRLGLATDSLSMMILALLTLLIIPLLRFTLRTTPKKLLVSYHGKNEEAVEKEQEPGFLEGLKLLLSHKYLIGIFGVNFIYEVIITIFDYNFKLAAATEYTGVALSSYLSQYGSSVNTISLICLLLGISNVTRFLGVGMALSLMPIIVGIALFGFITLDSLSFLFALMVGSKAINYALNGPALKQLYIPTTPDVRFKAQAWIETFGSRSSKQIGSLFNMTLLPLQRGFGNLAGKSYYLGVSAIVGFPLVVAWFFVARYLGKTFKKGIDQKKVIC